MADAPNDTVGKSSIKPSAAAPKPDAPKSDDLSSKSMEELMNIKVTSAPKMHKGGSITVDGNYNLKAGEHVLSAKEAEHLKGAHSKAKTVLSMTKGLTSLQRTGPKPPMSAPGGQATSPSAPAKPPQPMKPATKSPNPAMRKPAKSPIQVKPKATKGNENVHGKK